MEDINHIAQRYTALLSDVVKTPVVPEGYCSSWAQYTLQLSDASQRAPLQEALKALDIPTAIYYPIPMHKQTAFSYLNPDDNRCPVAERLSRTVISLPIHPYLSETDQDLICREVKKHL